MTERAWVLRSVNGELHGVGDTLETVMRFTSSNNAQREAQILAARPPTRTHQFLYAIPIERETVRKVGEIEGPAELWVLRDKSGDYAVNHCNFLCIGDPIVLDVLRNAKTFTVSEVFDNGGLGTSDFTPIPVRVTETPGEWKEVVDD